MVTLSFGEQCKSLVNLDPTPISSNKYTARERALGSMSHSVKVSRRRIL